MPNSEANFLKI